MRLFISFVKRLVSSMFEVKAEPGQHVIEEGEEGKHFYIVDDGVFEVFIPPSEGEGELQLSNTITTGGGFGELALMYSCARTATVIAKTTGNLWALDQLSFVRVLVQVSCCHLPNILFYAYLFHKILHM